LRLERWAGAGTWLFGVDVDHTASAPPKVGGSITLGTFLRNTWLPQKRRRVRATTAYRYSWFVDRSVMVQDMCKG
jgi:hypothetical protein